MDEVFRIGLKMDKFKKIASFLQLNPL
jgi:hypothetical protein